MLHGIGIFKTDSEYLQEKRFRCHSDLGDLQRVNSVESLFSHLPKGDDIYPMGGTKVG